jgi:hypothetical protein
MHPLTQVLVFLQAHGMLSLMVQELIVMERMIEHSADLHSMLLCQLTVLAFDEMLNSSSP